MTDQRAWQLSTALRRIEDARRQSFAEPIARLITEAAKYVGAPRDEVERWWNGRGR